MSALCGHFDMPAARLMNIARLRVSESINQMLFDLLIARTECDLPWKRLPKCQSGRGDMSPAGCDLLQDFADGRNRV